MSVQTEIIERYQEIHGFPTLKFISEDTCIQITRVFRILNGSEMKLSEYERFRNSMAKKGKKFQGRAAFFELVEQCWLGLSEDSLRELMILMDRKMRLKMLDGGMNQDEVLKEDFNVG